MYFIGMTECRISRMITSFITRVGRSLRWRSRRYLGHKPPAWMPARTSALMSGLGRPYRPTECPGWVENSNSGPLPPMSVSRPSKASRRTATALESGRSAPRVIQHFRTRPEGGNYSMTVFALVEIKVPTCSPLQILSTEPIWSKPKT